MKQLNRQSKIVYGLLKLFFIIDIFFIGYYQNRFKPIGGLATPLAIVVIVLFLLVLMTTGISYRRVLNPPILFWLLFGILTLVFSLILAQDRAGAINSLVIFIALVVFMMIINLIHILDGNLAFVFKVFMVLGILIALTIIFFGVTRIEGVGKYFTISNHSNRNNEAIMMVFGISGILYLSSFNKLLPSILSLLGIGVQFYAILQGGSRKGAIGVLILIVFWVIFSYRHIFNNYSPMIKLIHIIIWMGLVSALVYYIIPWITNSWAIDRLLNDLGANSSIEREKVQRAAVELFESSPVFGVGFDQVRVYVGVYAHSNPIELLADTGIIGILLYYIPFITIYYRLIRKLIEQKKNNIQDRESYSRIILILIIFIVISVFEIEMVSCQVYMTIIMYGVVASTAYKRITTAN